MHIYNTYIYIERERVVDFGGSERESLIPKSTKRKEQEGQLPNGDSCQKESICLELS